MAIYFYKDSTNDIFVVGDSILPTGKYILRTYTNNTIVSLEDSDAKVLVFDPIEITNLLKENDTAYTDLDDLLAGISDLFKSEGGGLSVVSTDGTLSGDGTPGDPLSVVGGGGAATQVAQGTAYTFLGELLNDSFPGTSLNATNWSGSLPTGASINDKLIIASGSAVWDRFITLTKHYLYEKQDIIVDVTAVTKSSGDAWGWGQTNFSAYTNTYVFWKFDQFTGILSAGTDSSANQYGSMQPIQFSAGDDLRFTWKRTPSKTYVIIENLTDSTVPKAYGEWDLCKWGSGNYYRLTFLGGQQEFTNITINSAVRNYVDNSDGIVVIGDSIGNGYGLTNRIDRFSDLLVKGQTHKYENLCVDSWGTGEYTTARLTEFLTNINGKYLIINLGYNDASRGTVLATFQTALENLATTAQGLGFEVIFVSMWPHRNTNESDYNTYMSNAATATSSIFIDIWDDLTTANLGEKEYYFDGVHPNLWGHVEISRFIDLQDGEIVDLLLDNFENEDIKFRGIGFSEELLPLAVIDSEGNVKKSDPQKYINKEPVQLQQGQDSDGYPQYTQTGRIRITGNIQNDGQYIQKADSTGLKIGFSNDVDDTLGSNINITNKQNASGRKQLFSTITGVRNLLLQGLIVKAGYTHQITGDGNVIIMCQGFTSISGDSNTLINTQINTSLSSGSDNIGIGNSALINITTGQKNIHISFGMSGVDYFTSALSNTIILGDVSNGNQYVANDFAISMGLGSPVNMWIGSRLALTPGVQHSISTARSYGTNFIGSHLNIDAGRGTGSGEPGTIKIRHSTPVGSGVGFQTTFTDTMVFNRVRVVCNRLLGLGKFTATEASALTPEDADLIYVTDTDATFTSVGVWAYENGSWIKL